MRIKTVVERLAPYLLFVVGALAMSFKILVPSFWQDEAATLAGANRPISALLGMATKIDVVHATYYGLMHFWTNIFGFSVLWMRLPSLLAVGLTCALLYVLVRKLNGSYSVAVIASLLYLVLPRTHFASSESRSNALTATMAVALTLILVWALQSKRSGWLTWSIYAVVAAASTYVFMFSMLIAVPHAVYLLLKNRKQLWQLFGAWALALMAASPVFYWGYQERGQVSWIKVKPLATYLYLAIIQVNFNGQFWLAATFILLSVVVLVVYIFNRRSNRHDNLNDLVELGLMWGVLPSAALIAASYALHPYFVEHYLTFTTPATAIIASVAIHKLRFVWLRILVAALVLWLGFMSLDSSRSAHAHGPAWMPEVQDIAAHTKPGDGILLPDWRTRNSAEVQIMMDSYRVGYLLGRVDLSLIETGAKSNTLFGIHSNEKEAPKPTKLMPTIALVTDSVDTMPIESQIPDWMLRNYKIDHVDHFDASNITFFKLK